MVVIRISSRHDFLETCQELRCEYEAARTRSEPSRSASMKYLKEELERICFVAGEFYTKSTRKPARDLLKKVKKECDEISEREAAARRAVEEAQRRVAASSPQLSRRS